MSNFKFGILADLIPVTKIMVTGETSVNIISSDLLILLFLIRFLLFSLYLRHILQRINKKIKLV